MKRRSILALIFLALFLVISFSIQFNLTQNIDSIVSLWALSIQNPSLIEVAQIIAFIFDPLTMIIISLIIAIFLFIRGMKKSSLFFAIIMLIAGLFIYIIKEISQRVRPINPFEHDFSFPSGHALISVVFFGLLAWLIIKNTKSKAIKGIVIILASFITPIIGFSRIYLNVHWLSDVVASFALGLFILFASLSVSIKQQ